MSQLKKVTSNANKKFVEQYYNRYKCSICGTPVEVNISPGTTTGYKYGLFCPKCNITLKTAYSHEKDELFGRALRQGYIKPIDN